MLSNNYTIYLGKIIGGFFYEIVFFPVWWYSKGLWRAIRGLKDFLVRREKSLAFFIWLKNIGRPMYADYSWQGIIISLFVRIFQIIARGLVLFFFLIISISGLVLWIALPILTLWQIFLQIF